MHYPKITIIIWPTSRKPRELAPYIIISTKLTKWMAEIMFSSDCMSVCARSEQSGRDNLTFMERGRGQDHADSHIFRC